MDRRWHVGVIAAALCTIALPGAGQAPFGAPVEPGGQAPPVMPVPPAAFEPLAPGPPIPGLAKRMGTIMALRHIVGMGYTRQDLEKALPILRQMRDSEKSLQAKAEQIMDEEKKTLLAAQPGNPPVTDPGAHLGEIVGQFAQDQGNRWRALAEAIGPAKMQGLRVLVAPGPQPMGPPGMPGTGPQNPFGPPNPGQPGTPGGPENPFGAPPPGAGPGEFPPQPGLAPQPPPGAPLGGVPVGPRGEPRAPLARRGQRGLPGRPGTGMPPSAMQQPGQPGMGPMSPPAMAVGPHLTLAELVDLLEQRLAAMKG